MEKPGKIMVFDNINLAWERIDGSKISIFIIVILNAFIVSSCFSLAYYLYNNVDQLLAFLLFGAGVVWQLIVFWSLINLGLWMADDVVVEVGMFKEILHFKLLLKLFVYHILVFIVVMLALIISAIILQDPFDSYSIKGILAHSHHPLLLQLIMTFVLLRMILGAAIIIDKKVNPWAALKLAWALSRGNVLKLFCLGFFWDMAMLIGVVTMGIGYIWMIPFVLTSYGLAYKTAASGTSGIEPHSEPRP